MNSTDPQPRDARRTEASAARHERSFVGAIASSLVLLVALPACNAVLGIDDATLCSGGGCDGGVPAFEDGANLPGAGRGNANSNDAGDDATDLDSELGAPGMLTPGSNGSAPSSNGSSNPETNPTPGTGASGSGNSGSDNSGSGNSGSGNSGSDNSGSNAPGGSDPGADNPGGSNPSGGNGNGNSGGGNSGGGNSGGSNGNPGPGGGAPSEPPPPPSPCAGRASGEAFCDGLTRISCGAGGAVMGSIACPSADLCAQSSTAGCAACLTGAAVCTGASLSVCNAAHTGFDAVACAGPAQCNAALGRCDAPACAPNQLRCDGAALQVCNATLTGFDPIVDCGSPAACNAQTGGCNICTPGTRRCVDSGTVGICDSSGQSEATIDCTPLIESCSAGE
ncbi:MAG TPA: hypothetical protein VMG12_22090, partial [Polyangiaceae bacterium]|nr:hypothetical protein [Polyangiaceae bacterium]